MSGSGAENPTVAIAGAGLGGLLLAQRLAGEGFEVRVFEADAGPFVRRQGYRITVDGEGIAALRSALPERLFRLALATGGPSGGSFRFTNERLRDAFRLDFPAAEDGGRQMDRQVLRSILLAGIEDRVRFGARAVDVSSTADSAALVLADGETVEADIVVAADGIGSALRSRVVPGAEPADPGAGGIYGRTPAVVDGRPVVPEALRSSGVLALLPGGSAFFFTSMRFGERPEEAFARLAPGHAVVAAEDYVMWGLVLGAGALAAVRGASPEELLAFAGQEVAEAHPLLGRLVAAAEPEATMLSAFAIGSRPEAWPLPRATILGDAVHPMPPLGAHGGNTALRDAALLGNSLVDAARDRTSLTEALRAYETGMVPAAFASVDAAARQLRRFTAGGMIQRWVMLRLLPLLHRSTLPRA